MNPLQFNVDVGDAALYLEITAWATAITLFVILAGFVLYLRHAGIGYEERRQLGTLIPQLFRTSPQSVTIRYDEGVSNRRERLRETLTRGIDETADTGEQTLRGAVREFGADVRSVLPNWPKLAIRGLLEGVFILLFGAMLFFSHQWWERALALPSVDASPLGVAAAIWHGLTVAIGLFPVPDELAIVGLSAAVLTASFLLEFWLPVGVTLIVAAVAFAAVDRVTDENLDVTLYPDRRKLVGAPILALLAVWATGVTVRFLIEQTPFADLAATLGFFAAVTHAAVWAAVFVGSAGIRIRDRQHRPGENTDAVAVYILLRRLLFGLVLLSFPLAAYLGIRAVGTGEAAAVLHIIVLAPLMTRLLLLGAIVSVIVVILSKTTGDIGFLDALGRLWRSTALRAWLFARGIPSTAMLLAFAITWSFTGSQPVGDIPFLSALLGLWPPLVAALLAGVFVRLWTLIWTRLRYRFMTFSEETGPASVLVGCYPELEDADGDAVYVARVQGRELAHRDVDALIRDIETTTEAIFDAEDVPATVASYYWGDLRRGTVDLEVVIEEIRGDVLSRLRATLAENGGRVDAAVIDEELQADYPEQAIEQMLQVLYERSDVSYRDGEYFYHGGVS